MMRLSPERSARSGSVTSAMMRTFRMVAEKGVNRYGTVLGLVCVDVVLRGERADVDVVASSVRAFLDIGIDLPGAWVDEGTDRDTVTLAVTP